MKEQLTAALKAKQAAEAEAAEGQAAVLAAQAAAAAAAAEAGKLRRDLAEARAKQHELEAQVVQLQGSTELSKLRADYNNCKAALAEAEQVGFRVQECEHRCWCMDVEDKPDEHRNVEADSIAAAMVACAVE